MPHCWENLIDKWRKILTFCCLCAYPFFVNSSTFVVSEEDPFVKRLVLALQNGGSRGATCSSEQWLKLN